MELDISIDMSEDTHKLYFVVCKMHSSWKKRFENAHNM